MNYLLFGLLCFSQAVEGDVKEDFTPKVRFLFKNPTNTTVTVHTAEVSVERVWVFRPFVPPLAPVDLPEVVTIELDPGKVPLTIRRTIARKVPPNDVDRVEFHFRLKPWNFEKYGQKGAVYEKDAVVFSCRMKLLYGQSNASLESESMLIFIKNFGSGFDRSIEQAIETNMVLGASRELAEATVKADAAANRKAAQELAKRIEAGDKYNNNLKDFVDDLLTPR